MPWIFIVITFGTIAINFLLFVIVFRHHATFKTEKNILTLQIRSVGALIAIGVLYFLMNSNIECAIAIFTGLIVHGIYSLTFLEFWALSQGSFSLESLKKISYEEFNADVMQQLVKKGDEKLQSRIVGLKKGGFIKLTYSKYQLTKRGYVLAFFLKSIKKICVIRDAG